MNRKKCIHFHSSVTSLIEHVLNNLAKIKWKEQSEYIIYSVQCIQAWPTGSPINKLLSFLPAAFGHLALLKLYLV